MVIFERKIEKEIKSKLFTGKVIILYGPRQVGKTTLMKKLVAEYGGAYFSCDEPDIAEALTHKTSTQMKAFLGTHRLVVLDEAQRIPDIGTSLKLLVDNFPDMQIVATGSSSFDLANKVNEPLTGRNWEFRMHSLTLEEYALSHTEQEASRLVDNFLVYGSYPELLVKPELRTDILSKITSDYLYKDILSYDGIRKPDILHKLLRALALQVGSLVSYSELSRSMGVSRQTVESYIGILEKAFIIFRLPPLTNNRRDEIKRMNKIYFYDNGTLNTLLQNYNSPVNRSDVGAIFENFFVAEKAKIAFYSKNNPNYYYWRTKDGQEVDLVAEFVSDRAFHAFECKYSGERLPLHRSFVERYHPKSYSLVNRNSLLEFSH